LSQHKLASKYARGSKFLESAAPIVFGVENAFVNNTCTKRPRVNRVLPWLHGKEHIYYQRSLIATSTTATDGGLRRNKMHMRVLVILHLLILMDLNTKSDCANHHGKKQAFFKFAFKEARYLLS
jgi:hypothetical protein